MRNPIPAPANRTDIPILIVALIAQVGGWRYLIELLARTKYGQFATSIGNDVVALAYTTSVVAFAAPLFLLLKRNWPARSINLILATAGLLMLLGYSWLHLTNKIGQIS